MPMGLLWMDRGSEFQVLVDAAYEHERAANAAYFARLDQRQQRHFREDTRYNVDFLYTALALDDAHVMQTYAVWLYVLMKGIFKDSPNASDQALHCVLSNLDCIKLAAHDVVAPEKLPRIIELVDAGRESVTAYVAHLDGTPAVSCAYEDQVSRYLDALFSRNTRAAMTLVREFVAGGLSVVTVYVDILAEAMRRVGEMWHTGAITVDTEHYCTSVTQTAMSQLYPQIFAAPRRGKTILCACPGAELHEMAARMVADLFESDGWDSVYLGAAVPEENLLDAVRENHPNLVALSVTMPQFLLECESAVRALKQEFPQVKVAVGGRAFESTDDVWRKWPIDVYARDARELLRQANELAG